MLAIHSHVVLAVVVSVSLVNGRGATHRIVVGTLCMIHKLQRIEMGIALNELIRVRVGRLIGVLVAWTRRG